MWGLDGGWLACTHSLHPGGTCLLDAPCSKGCPYDPAHCQQALPEPALMDFPRALEVSSASGVKTMLGTSNAFLTRSLRKMKLGTVSDRNSLSVQDNVALH